LHTGRLETVTYPASAIGRFQARYSYLRGYLQNVCQGQVGGACVNDLYTVGLPFAPPTLSPMDALGRITRAWFGNETNNGAVEHYSFDPANPRLSAIQTITPGQPLAQDYAYQWDRNGNLTRRTQPNAQENFSYDAFNRLDVASLTAGGTTTPTLDMAYDPNGNITSKTVGGAGGGTGTYSYATTGGGPHAVSNISGNHGGTFHYDAAGNLDCRSWNTGAGACNAGSTTLWYSFNLPKRIGYSSTDTYADFSYGPNREWVRTTEHEGSAERVIYHVGPHFEVETSTAYTGTHYRATVYFGERAVYARVDGPSLLEEGYLHQDHLGSLDKVTNIYGIPGTAKTSLSFDAFGKRRNTDWSNDNTDALFAETQWLERGYTGHRQLDGVRLIHMNGRVQNPAWGRMLSPDPVVGDLTRPQSLNAYSYVMNNPLSFTDPTGFAPDAADTPEHITVETTKYCDYCFTDQSFIEDMSFNLTENSSGRLTLATLERAFNQAFAKHLTKDQKKSLAGYRAALGRTSWGRGGVVPSQGILMALAAMISHQYGFSAIYCNTGQAGCTWARADESQHRVVGPGSGSSTYYNSGDTAFLWIVSPASESDLGPSFYGGEVSLSFPGSGEAFVSATALHWLCCGDVSYHMWQMGDMIGVDVVGSGLNYYVPGWFNQVIGPGFIHDVIDRRRDWILGD
ncbi:MAG: RHS repeat-associated core domain-containing protein, partial [Gammaproteobacteria bacterium]|nr:RHS repeat-associated core domain-containing protein [Gammaproteobacteria bacterium]